MAFAILILGNLNGFSYFHDLERIYLRPPPPRLTHLQCFLPRVSLYYRAGLKLLYLLSLLQLQNERSFWLLFQVFPNFQQYSQTSLHDCALSFLSPPNDQKDFVVTVQTQRPWDLVSTQVGIRWKYGWLNVQRVNFEQSEMRAGRFFFFFSI